MGHRGRCWVAVTQEGSSGRHYCRHRHLFHQQVTIVYDAAVETHASLVDAVDEIGFVASVAGAAAAAAADVAGYLEVLPGTAGDAGAGAEVTGAEVVLTMDPSMEMEVEEVD